MGFEDLKETIIKNGGLKENQYVIGIDLGTTNSVISYWDAKNFRSEPLDISNGFGKIPLPSVVQYREESDEWVFGEEAYRSMKIYSESTIRSIKRKMDTNERILIGGQELLPEDISAKILKELTAHCSSLNPNAEIVGLVVSVPYDFSDAAKRATIRACEKAGLGEKLICLIEEPKAAALAYNFRHELNEGERIMVFDFGGGTLDITIFHVTEKTDKKIKLEVISEGGEAFHGGDNIDEEILNKCYKLIYKKIGRKPDEIEVENQAELIMRSRETKERLTGVKSFRIPFTFCVPPFVEQITREKFEELIYSFIDKTHKLVLKCLRESYIGPIEPNDINRVLLEGGSSQMPWVKTMLINIFNSENKIYTSERPAVDISIGATYYAAMKMGLINCSDIEANKIDVEFKVTIPHDIGFEVVSGNKASFFKMIQRGTTYALAKREHIFILRGTKPEEMTSFNLKILERIDRDDDIENCKLIGEIEVNGLPKRPIGKTKIKIILSISEDGGIVKGSVTDIGFGEEFLPSGFKIEFSPNKFSKQILEG